MAHECRLTLGGGYDLVGNSCLPNDFYCWVGLASTGLGKGASDLLSKGGSAQTFSGDHLWGLGGPCWGSLDSSRRSRSCGGGGVGDSSGRIRFSLHHLEVVMS
ncbi:MAG: hypothetical protein Q7K54_03700 [Candidatus Parcubacteria bacterium]|nr:hypothetical protein [Candidatus Parcubacteria bacterium]